MRVLKLLLLVLAAATGLVALAIAIVVWLVDPNDYRDEIARLVASRTGRELVIEGDLALRFFPWLGVDVGRARLGNAAGFGPEPFLTVDGARLDVRLLPLLVGRVEMGEVVLEAPHLRLVTAANGASNWSSFETSPNGAQAQVAATAPPSIARLTVHDGRIELIDAGTGSEIALTDLELESGRFSPERPFPVELAFAMRGTHVPSASVSLATRLTVSGDMNALAFEAPALEAHVAAKADEEVPITAKAERIDVDLAAQRYAALAPHIAATVPRGSDDVPITFAAQRVEADLARGDANCPEFALDLAGAQLTGSLAASDLLTAPAVNGHIALAPVALRGWLERLAIDVPQTTDPRALAALALRARIEANGNRIALSDLDAQLDESRITGRVAVTDFAQRAIEFDLDVDRIDLDRYLLPGAGDQPPAGIPVELLRGQPARGEVRIAAARLAGVRLEGVKLGVDTGADPTRTRADRAREAGPANAMQPSGDSRVTGSWLADTTNLTTPTGAATADASP